MQVPFLGQIPLDQRVAQACDEGKSFFELYPDSAPALAYKNIVKGLDASYVMNFPCINSFFSIRAAVADRLQSPWR